MSTTFIVDANSWKWIFTMKQLILSVKPIKKDLYIIHILIGIVCSPWESNERPMAVLGHRVTIATSPDA
jgi:hypothetical protein